MRKLFLDNIKWITVVIVVIYHVIYMFNGVQTAGVIGPFHENQIQDAFQYLVYPWFMALLFAVSGMSSKYASNLPASVIYLLVAVSSFTGAFILYEIISRIPFLRWAVLGIKKKTNM